MITMRKALTSSGRQRRGTVLLEFMMIFPLFLFLVLFSVDMGRMILVSGALTDSAYVAARSGAQRGSAYENDNARRAFERAVEAIPGTADSSTTGFTIVQGECNSANSYIVVEASRQISFITPGLSALLGLVDRPDADRLNSAAGWTVSSRGSVLCEIVRR